MKKILTLIFCVTLFFHEASSQEYINDAFELTEYIIPGSTPPKFIIVNSVDSITKEKQKQIVKRYCEIINKYYDNKFITDVELIDKLGDVRRPEYNPLIGPYLTPGGIAAVHQNNLARAKSLLSGGIFSLGNLDVTNFSDALARFLIKRGKEELNVAFFSKLKKFIEENSEAKILYPKTANVLSHIGATRYAELIQTIRKAFEEDLKKIPENAYKLLETDRYKKLNSQFPELGIVLRTAHTLSTINPVANPVSFISEIATYSEWTSLNSNLGNGFKALDVISTSLRNASDSMWISLKDLQWLYGNKNAFKIYIGLLYAKSDSIEFKDNRDTIQFKVFLARLASNEKEIRRIIEDFIVMTDRIKALSNEIKANKNEVNNDIIYNYLNRTVDIVDYGADIANRIRPGLVDEKNLEYASQGIEIYRYTYTKDYSSAIFSLYCLIKDIVEDPKFETLQSNLKNELKSEKDKTTSDTTTINNLKEQKEAIKNLSRFIEKLLTFGNFIASVAKAESPDEIKEVIEASALPAGSSRIKKQANWSISLNAYVGYYSGKSKNDSINAWSVNKGITAPIGISFNKGFHKGGALSLFATLINIGAVVDYRLSDDSSSIKQVIHLENILSPGLFITYGFGFNLPLSIGWGMQYGPRLFKVEKENLGLSDEPYWRSNWFITIDIPITHFTSSIKRSRSIF